MSPSASASASASATAPVAVPTKKPRSRSRSPARDDKQQPLTLTGAPRAEGEARFSTARLITVASITKLRDRDLPITDASSTSASAATSQKTAASSSSTKAKAAEAAQSAQGTSSSQLQQERRSENVKRLKSRVFSVRAIYETLRAELVKREATLREAGAMFAYETDVAELEGWLRQRREPLLSSEVRSATPRTLMNYRILIYNITLESKL